MTKNKFKKKWETDNIVVTYIAPSPERATIDSKQLKIDQPKIYEQYLKSITN